MKQALLVIDVQKDYFPGGRNELYQAEEALKAVKKLVITCREREIPVIFIKHLMDAPAPFFEIGTDGIEIHPDIAPLPNEAVVEKRSPGSFHETKLNELLLKLQVEELLVCGMMTHMCVDTTVREAKDLGYRIKVFSDACTTSDLAFEEVLIKAATVNAAFLASLNGAFAEVETVEKFERIRL